MEPERDQATDEDIARENEANFTHQEHEAKKGRLYRAEVYEAADGWRWRIFAANGENVGNGSEAYDNKFNAERALTIFMGAMVRLFADRVD